MVSDGNIHCCWSQSKVGATPHLRSHASGLVASAAVGLHCADNGLSNCYVRVELCNGAKERPVDRILMGIVVMIGDLQMYTQ